MIAISCACLLVTTKNRDLKCTTKNNRKIKQEKNSVDVFPLDMSNILCLKTFFSIEFHLSVSHFITAV